MLQDWYKEMCLAAWGRLYEVTAKTTAKALGVTIAEEEVV